MNYKINKVLLILSIALMIISCRSSEKQEIKNHSENKPLQTTRVQQKPSVLEVAGTVRAADVAEIASRYGGFVTRIPAKTGRKIQKGELLILMDDRTLSAQKEKLGSTREEMNQAIQEARHHLEAAESQSELASTTYERFRKLYEKKAASPQEYQEALSRKNSAEAAKQAAAEKVAQAEARLNQISSDEKELAANQSYVRIESPFAGVVTAVSVDPGTFVSPGQSLVTVEKPGSYQIAFYVEQDLLQLVNEGKTLQVRIPAAGKELLKAVVSEVSPSQDHATRTFLVKADLAKASGVRSGFSAYVMMESRDRSSLWIPRSYLTKNADLEMVYVKQGEDWKKVLVKTGVRNDQTVEILSGLNEGEEIGLMED
jgi:membrane fusion protein, multidrug efflux system